MFPKIIQQLEVELRSGAISRKGRHVCSYSNWLRNCCKTDGKTEKHIMPKSIKYEPDGCPNRYNIDEKSRLQRGCVFGAFQAPKGSEKGATPDLERQRLATIFGPKSEKRHSKKHKKTMPKKYRKCMPKGFQNEAKMDAKSIDVSYFFERG